MLTLSGRALHGKVLDGRTAREDRGAHGVGRESKARPRGKRGQGPKGLRGGSRLRRRHSTQVFLSPALSPSRIFTWL